LTIYTNKLLTSNSYAGFIVPTTAVSSKNGDQNCFDFGIWAEDSSYFDLFNAVGFASNAQDLLL
jgi:hypothetical protein